MNTQTIVSSGVKQAQHNTTLAPSEVSTAATAANHEAFDLGAKTVTDSNDIHTTVGARQLGVQSARAVRGTATVTPDSQHCYTTWTGNSANHYEVYGQSNGDYGVWSQLVERMDESHSVGLAVEYNGRWGESGSAAISIENGNSIEDDPARHGYSIRYSNTLHWDEYYYTCQEGNYDTYTWRPTYTADVDSYHKTVSEPFYSMSCINRSANSSMTFGNNVTVTNDYGASVAGLSLTVKDTWSSDIEDKFQWVNSGELCGDSSYGTAQSQHVDGDRFHV